MDKIGTVRKMFEDESEVEFYKSLTKTGLFNIEKDIFSKFLKPKSSILVLGCGAGREALAFAKEGHDVTAVDFSERMIEEAKKISKGEEIEYLCENMLTMELDEKYDCITMLAQLIEHVPERKARIGLLERLKGYLNKNGTIVMTTHERNIDDGYRLMWTMEYVMKKPFDWGYELGDTRLAKTQPEIKKEKRNGMFFHLYTRKEAAEDIRSAGLKLEKTVSDKEVFGQNRKVQSERIFYVCRKAFK